MQPEPADRYPLAPLQRGMLFHALASPGSTMYVEQLRHTLAGELDLAAFGAAWEAVCVRHPALRTGFDWEDADRPRQVVRPAVNPPLVTEDLRDTPARLPEVAAAERERGFDLARAPLFRLRLVRLGDRRWQLLWTYHHLVLDGWSAGVVLHDVATGYERRAIPDAPPYREFVARADGQDLPAARRYWTGVLAGFTEPTPLGITRPAGAAGAPPERIGHPLPDELADRLDRFAGAHRLTLDTLLTGAWAVVLGRYAGTDDVVFGVTTPGRSEPGLERMAGLLINTLPARIRLDRDRPMAQWLAALHRERADTRAWELTPLDRVQAWSDLPAGRQLFDSILVVEDFPADPAGLDRLGDLEVTESVSVQQTNYPLTLLVHPRRRLVEALFDPGVLDPDAVRRLLGHLTTVLDGLTTAGVLGEVDPLPPAERAALAARGAPRAGFPPEPAGLVPARFAGWARREPDRVAVSCGDQRVRYRELLARVARLTRRLRELGVGPEVLVGICLPRGLDLVVAVLAVACAGGGYVPVDRRHPPARVRTVLADASVAALLTDRALAAELGGPAGAVAPATVCLDDPAEQERLASLPETLPPPAAGAADPAYVIYTSGSTGTPKGVVVEHAQLARLFDATHEWFRFGPDDVWTLFHSIAFDFSVWELWGALASGGRLVVVPDELTRDPGRFRELLLAEGVTVLNQTPSSFRALQHADLEATPTPSPYRLRRVILGGEQLEVASLRPWLERYGDQRPELVNMYGITETTVHVTYRPIRRADLAAGVPSPIGEPIPDLAVRLVDPQGRPAPVGVPGELHVGGAGVARGYLRRPELTAQRFVTGPDGGRWYRTGDRARWLADGGLEFLGRLDDQVKIRGHRIELGEIESVLNGHPGVREAAVIATESGPDRHRQLVAYLVAPEPPVEALREWLSERVPDYLVPARFVSLDRLPLTPNGKLDRAALPAPDPAAAEPDGQLAPRTDLERELAQVWAEVLGRDQVGVADNFFALGGDSILIVQVASRARRRGISVTPAQVFAHQTVAELARVAGRAGEAVVEAEQGEVTGEVPATPVQAWFHRLDLPHPAQWNLPVLLEARRPVPAGQLAEALSTLVAHHDALRLRVTVDDRGRPSQRIVPVADHGPVPVEELARLDATGMAETVARLQTGLDLARGPLVRAAVFRTPDGEPDRLLLVAHHLVVDTVSWRILLEDLTTALGQLAAGEPVRLPAKTTDFGAWARQLTELARGEQVAAEATWWLTALRPDPPDREPPGLEADTEVVEVALDEPASQDLLAPANLAHRTRTEELLLAGLVQAMAQWSGQPRLLVDVEGHGRDAMVDADVSRTVGWFTTFTPAWLDLSGVEGLPGPVVKAVKEQLRAMPRAAAHGLARWLAGGELARRLSEQPQARVSFNYLGRLDQQLPAEAGFTLAPEPVAGARHPANPRPYPIDVVAGVRDGRLRVYLGYSTRHHSRATMQGLAAAYLEALRSIVAYCREPGAGGPTPSDFPLAQVDQRQLDRLAETHGPIEDLYPLTPLQRGLLFHTLANPGSGVYFEQFSIRLDGPLDLPAFTRAWTELLARHAVLRAGIAWQGLAIPHLVVRDHAELPLAHHDWRELDEPAQQQRLAGLLAEDRTTGFDLTRAPLTRLQLVRLADERWQLVWSHHHVILDGWSVALLIQEVFDTYEAIRTGQHRPAPPPPPFRDYLAYLSGLDHAAAWTHWRRVLSGVTGPTPLGADRTARPTASLAALDRSDATSGPTGRRDADYARVYRRLPADRSDAVREFARAHRLTLDAVLHGAWALVLAHRSGHDDVVFGTTSAGRPPALSGVEAMVGLFINTLPARVRVRREQPVLAWLAGLLRDQVRTREYEHTPLDQIRGWTSVPPDQPLFDSGRALENYPMDGSRLRAGSVTISDIRTFEQANFALTFIVVPDEALSLQLWYDAARFAPETAEHLLAAAETLTLGLAGDPDRTVGEVLDLIPASPLHPEPGVDPSLARRLHALPLVREAVVRPAAGGRLAAYLVPDPGTGDGGFAERHVAAWRSVHDQTYAAGGAATDPTRHFVGWNSSYTGEPIPAEAMAEWRAGTIERIRALHPARILEIGCGTGLLLSGLLDDCEHYLGIDFSAVALAQVREHLAIRDPATRAKVTLRQQTADDPTGLAPDGFDVVILNSVVQYFPGPSYLDEVLDVALRAAAPGGAVFLGDLRHHGLLAAFHTSVELHRAVDMLPADELHRRVSRSLAREQELLVDPAYLTALPARRPEVGAVAVLPRRGRHDNELTRYRYDAVLRLGPPPPAPSDIEWYDWHRDVLSRSEIGWLLEHAGGDAVGVTGVPNTRVAVDVRAASLLAGGDGPATAGELRLAAGKAPSGMDPEELYQLGEQRGWAVAVSWAVHHPDGSLNALFQRGTPDPAGHVLAQAGEPDDLEAGPLTNPPLRSTLAIELERQARAALADHPGEVSVLVVDELPRTADGSLDEAALPPPPDPLPEVEFATGTVPARTADELRLARIWEQALGTGALDVRTSFFDLGGDSLLAIRVIDEASRALGRDVPLATLLRWPTIEGMAAALRAESRPWTPLVEVTGGDEPPFFCVHPAGGNVLCYGELARLLAPRPFCALQARGVEGDEPPYDALPAMAARYLADVRARQPAGSYRLGGWSMGGLVAYEMAQQLVAAGATVELLALIETPVPGLVDELPDEAAALARLLDGVVPLDPERLRAMPPADRLRYVLAEAERAQVVPPGMDPSRAQRLLDVYTTHLAAVRRYRPRPYGGRSLLLRAAETPITAPDYGWGPLLTGAWEVVEVPGSHESVVWPPHVHRLAEVLRTRLA